MKSIPVFRLLILFVLVHQSTIAQVDTTFVYNENAPYGPLDIRVAVSPSTFYYLEEGVTFSFRQTPNGEKTNSHTKMAEWDTKDYQQGNLRKKRGGADDFIMNYRLLFPANYKTDYKDGYPMVLILHGAGATGNCWENRCLWATESWRPGTNDPPAPTDPEHHLLNNEKNLNYGGRDALRARNLAGDKLPDDPSMPARAFPGFTLVPQNLNGWDIAAVQDVIRLTRLVAKRYNIDPNRIYVHGLSNGGIATYEVIKRAPWLFAAALPMSAPADAGISSARLGGSIAEIPVWIFQGAEDLAPTPEKTKTCISYLEECGAEVRYTEYPNLGHRIINTVVKEPEFYTWMLAQSKSRVHVFKGICDLRTTNGAGIRLSLSEGFYAYEWEFNGKKMENAKSSFITATEPGVYRARFSRVNNPGPEDWNQWSKPVRITGDAPPMPQRTTLSREDLTTLMRILSYREQLYVRAAIAGFDTNILEAVIFPNPAFVDERIVLKLNFTKPSRTELNLVDILGKSYFRSSWHPGMPTEMVITPTQSMSAGLYIMILRSENTLLRRKLVIRN